MRFSVRAALFSEKPLLRIGGIRRLGRAICDYRVRIGERAERVGIFSLFFVGFGIATRQGPIGIPIICAKVVTAVAYGIKNPKVLRLLSFPTSLCRLVYNIYAQSIAGILCELFTCISIPVALFRIDFRRSDKVRPDEMTK